MAWMSPGIRRCIICDQGIARNNEVLEKLSRLSLLKLGIAAKKEGWDLKNVKEEMWRDLRLAKSIPGA